MISLIRFSSETSLAVHLQADLHSVSFRELAAFVESRSDLLGGPLPVFPFDEAVGADLHAAAAAVMSQDHELLS